MSTITEHELENAMKADPKSDDIGEGYNVRTSAYLDAHGGEAWLDYYDYVDLGSEYMMIIKKSCDSEKANKILQMKYPNHGKCIACGTAIKHHYFTTFADGKSGPLGSECLEMMTGIDAGNAFQKAAQKAIRDTVKRRKARTAKTVVQGWFEEKNFTEEQLGEEHIHINHYKKLCPYPTEKEFNSKWEVEHWEDDEGAKQLKSFIEKHKDCSEFMSSCHHSPTYGRFQAVERSGCRICRKGFRVKFGKRPKPNHFTICDEKYVEPVRDQDAIIVEGKTTGCPAPGKCIEAIESNAKLIWLKNGIESMVKFDSQTYYNCVSGASVLRNVGINVPKFEDVKPEPLDDMEKKLLTAKINKEIEKVTKLIDRYKEA